MPHDSHRQGVADALAEFAARTRSGARRGLRIGPDLTPGPLLPDARPVRAPRQRSDHEFEADVLRAVKDALNARQIKWWRNQVAHASTAGGGRVIIGEPGMPDLMALTTASHPRGAGVLVCIECKRPTGGVLSDAQRHWLDDARAHGAIAGVARSVADALALVGLAP